MSSRPQAEPPLARLFAMAFRDLLDGLHERLVLKGWLDVRPPYGVVLLAARDRPTTATELAALMGVSKQATSKLVDAMVDAGYVERQVGVDDARQRAVSLTPRGAELLSAVEEIYEELEAEWAAEIGERAVERVRTDLARVLRSRHGGTLPPVRPGW